MEKSLNSTIINHRYKQILTYVDNDKNKTPPISHSDKVVTVALDIEFERKN